MDNLAEAGSIQNGLPSLNISGFRGIGQLEIPRLGRVALLAGKNGVGKTTVLDALRIYAARGRPDALQNLLLHRDELTTVRDADDKPFSVPAMQRLFHQNGGDRVAIEIGPVDSRSTLKIKGIDELSDVPYKLREHVDAEGIEVVCVAFNGVQSFYLWSDSHWAYRRPPWNEDKLTAPIRCESVGPRPLHSDEIARLWEHVALTDDEALPLDALRIVFGDHVERAAVIGQGMPGARRRVIVKLASQAAPVPLRSLGDGATRMFGVALALANCRDGILLIDEAENGIHYALHRNFWNMVLRTAQVHNAQVVATTHSKGCINGFAAAALDCPDISGNLIRIERHNGELRAIDYSKEELETAAEQNIEVR